VEYSRNLLFRSSRQMEEIFQSLIDRARALLHLDRVKTIFGNKSRPHYPGKPAVACVRGAEQGGGIDFNKPRMHQAAEAVLALSHSPTSAKVFTASDLAQKVRKMNSQGETDYGPRETAGQRYGSEDRNLASFRIRSRRSTCNRRAAAPSKIIRPPRNWLDSGNRYHRMVESLEPQHRPDSLLHSPMILLHPIVQAGWIVPGRDTEVRRLPASLAPPGAGPHRRPVRELLHSDVTYQQHPS
jgi:hypothetical protein